MTKKPGENEPVRHFKVFNEDTQQWERQPRKFITTSKPRPPAPPQMPAKKAAAKKAAANTTKPADAK